MKKYHIIISGVFLFLLLFIIADYYELFGTRIENKYEFIEITFKPVDEETGAPVFDVHLRCFQMHNNNACSEINGRKSGYLTAKIPLTKIITRTLFFQKDIHYQETADPNLHIMFIHNEYANPVETFDIKDMPSISDKVIKVLMPKPLLRN